MPFTYAYRSNSREEISAKIPNNRQVYPHISTKYNFANIPIHPKLSVGRPNDTYEKEADQIAEQIVSDAGMKHQPRITDDRSMTGRIGTLRQSPVVGANQNTEVSDDTASLVRDTLNSRGQPLDSSTRLFMESQFGHDFGNIRIHTGSNASDSARSLGALAYTVGKEIVFREGMNNPQTSEGQRLIAHELVHVVQQEDASAVGAATVGMVQRREAEDEEGNEKKKDAGDVIADGLKTVAEQAKDNNPKVKKEIIEPLKKTAKSKVEGLSTGQKAVGISFGVATLGLTAGSLLSDPKGRKLLEGVNLGAPLALVPYMPLTGFNYTLPSGEGGDKSLFRFETTFSGNDYLKLLSEHTNLPNMSLGVKMQWGYDPEGKQLSVLGAQAQLGLMPGVSVTGGTYSNILPMPETFITPEGGMVTSKKRIPDAGRESIPDTRIMLSIDLLKLDKRIIGKRLHSILHSF